MSSAILYLAIVAIWACVLIPRWLKRDSSASEKAETETEEATPLQGDAEPTDGEAPEAEDRDRSRRRQRSEMRRDERPEVRRDEARGEARRYEARGEARRYEARTEIRYEARVEVRDEEVRARRDEVARQERDEARRARRDEALRRAEHSAERAEAAAERDEDFESGRMELARDPEHRRVLSARRRLLTMLVVLTVGSVALAVSKLAALWVVVPPSVMLISYVILLREAARADAERARALGRAWREDERAEAGTAPAKAPTAPATPATPATPPAPDRVAATTGAQIIDLPTERVGQEFYDQYADVKRRAVGDLSGVGG